MGSAHVVGSAEGTWQVIKQRFSGVLSVLWAGLFAVSCISSHTEARDMKTQRIDAMFEKTKAVCLGRFVIDVPAGAAVLAGPQIFNGAIETMPSRIHSAAPVIAVKAKELRATKHATLSGNLLQDELTIGPISKNTIVFFDDVAATRVVSVWGWIRSEPIDAIYKGGARLKDDGIRQELDSVNYIAAHLRARDPTEAPPEPGVCLDVGFIADDTGRFQEIFGIGLRFPDLPDVSFSVSSNKNAQQGDSFEDRRAEAKRAAFLVAPMATLFNKVKTLREGKLKVQQGEGSEALFRRPLEEGGGAWHEFQFEYAGKRFDHRNPSWDASLFTGVAHNQAGSRPSSLTDEEAMALWDRLMSSVRLRVPTK